MAEVIEHVHHHWDTLVVHRPAKGGTLPDAVSESSLVVQRGLDQAGLALAARLEDAGVRCINPIAATLTCHDRASVMRALSDADIPVPETRVVPTWMEFLSLANGRQIVAKTLDGNAGRGVNVLISPSGILPSDAPFEGPFIAQQYLPNSSTVQKLYVAGHQTRGLLKNSPLLPEPIDASVPFEVDPELQDVAARIAEALQLDVFGADIILGPDGPAVIDVNPFPGFRGVREGPSPITSLRFRTPRPDTNFGWRVLDSLVAAELVSAQISGRETLDHDQGCTTVYPKSVREVAGSEG
jgi:ribosomal protein S6--L-glutamate ligase